MITHATQPPILDRPLATLRNVGKATLADFMQLGIQNVAQLATAEPDALYLELCHKTGTRQDPCVHDVFAAAIHQARTGEALDWWAFTPARKARQRNGTFAGLSQSAPARR